MHTLLKAGLALAVTAFACPAAYAADTAPAIPEASGSISIPPVMEAEIRAMARASAAPNTDPAAMESRMMTLVRAHLVEIAKDPAHIAYVNELMASAAAGDPGAREDIHNALMSLLKTP
ncbi:MAG: hypothetical protein ABIO39_13340 [Caulobacteraceae bacterium]